MENCICTLRNLSYRLELEMPPSRLIDNQETDGLLGSESPSKEADYSCWGRKRKKKRKSIQEEQVSHKRLHAVKQEQDYGYTYSIYNIYRHRLGFGVGKKPDTECLSPCSVILPYRFYTNVLKRI